MDPTITEVHRTPYGFERLESKDFKPVDGRVGALEKAREAKKTYAGDSPATPFALSKLAISPVQATYKSDPEAFYGDRDPNFSIDHEQPIHRLMVVMRSEGKSYTEIAAATGYSKTWVSEICRQPWFKLRLVSRLHEVGIDVLQTTLKAAATDSVFKLIELRDGEKTPAAVVKAACDSLLDRFLGKPVAKVETTHLKTPSSEETRKIDAEIKSIDEQLAQLPNHEKPETAPV